ncbi:CHASE2 domain-containing protein [Motiliproteus sp. MSK22-1]|uniref:CHASE2 domain-containing protein n=1 Tax=Motiliproteus sp. MSK22-1 TaxID=1897630 RepID=UPI0009775EF3|nr:adenylate/guanylate cyclase domain-containing protein [Motiliproteus sp. MSK22-1]OMH30391.1 hypothetical protein BGP75_18615 [Motiliproteus sp. MSK22-1]
MPGSLFSNNRVALSQVKNLRWILLLFSWLCASAALWIAEPPRWYSGLELSSYDLRVQAVENQTPDSRILIVNIDEESIARLGRWPWPREIITDLLRKLVEDYQVSLIGLDIFFPELEYSNAPYSLESSAEKFSADEKLSPAETALLSLLESYPIVLSQTFAFTADQSIKVGMAGKPSIVFDGLDQLPIASGLFANHRLFSEVAQVGHISPSYDIDGVVRRQYPLIQYKNQAYQSLSLALLQIFMQLPLEYHYQPDHLSVTVEGSPFMEIPLDGDGQMLVPFQGERGHFNYVSAVDVLEGTVDKSLLKDRVILIGSTAAGIFDRVPTPVNELYPGVEVHATLFSALLDQSYWKVPENQGLILTLLNFFLFVTLWRVHHYFGINGTWIASSLLASLWVLVVWVCWNQQQWVISATPPLLFLFMASALTLPFDLWQSMRERQHIVDLFGAYVPVTVAEKLLEDTRRNWMEPEKKELTVFFMDIRGFTSIAEKLDPEQLAQLVNRVLSEVTEAIHLQGGTIDKYIGDAVMAFWGAPIDQPDHAQRALDAAEQVMFRLQSLNRQLANEELPEIRVGIGINTGVVTVGDMGSKFRRSYTVMGDAVNLAARLEQQSKVVGKPVLLGEQTAMAVSDQSVRPLGIFDIRGREQKEQVYEPVWSIVKIRT